MEPFVRLIFSNGRIVDVDRPRDNLTREDFIHVAESIRELYQIDLLRAEYWKDGAYEKTVYDISANAGGNL